MGEGRAGITCHEWMPFLLPHLPEHLVDPSAFERLSALSECLPGTVTGAIEIRLTPGLAPVDLAVRICASREARQIAQYMKSTCARDFLFQWAQDRNPLLPFLWLEYDIPTAGEAPQAPVLIPRVARKAEPDWLIDSLLPTLRGKPLSLGQRDVFQRVLAGLPKNSWCCYVFDLQPRGTDAVRMSLTGLSLANMPDHLEQLARPDLAAMVREAVTLLEAPAHFELNFEVEENAEIRSRVGIEVSFTSWPGDDPRWMTLLDRLTDAKLCCPEKRDAVIAWPGYDSARRSPDRWPLAKEMAGTYLVRWISHVKLVCVPGEPIEAKVYLLFGLWTRLPDGQLEQGAAGLEKLGYV